MNEPAAPRHILHLVTEGLLPARLEELRKNASEPGDTNVEIVSLTKENAADVLAKVFAADSVAVWGGLLDA